MHVGFGQNHTIKLHVLYLFGYNISQSFFFSFRKKSKNLGLSYKTDLDLWDCFGRVKLLL